VTTRAGWGWVVVVVGATVSRGPEAVVTGAGVDAVEATVVEAAEVGVDGVDVVDGAEVGVVEDVAVDRPVDPARVADEVDPSATRMTTATRATTMIAAVHHLSVLVTGPA
jgi:hypothetical protein